MAKSRCTCGQVIRWKADEPESDEWLLVAKPEIPDALNHMTLGGWSGAFCPACGRLWISWGGPRLEEYVPTSSATRAPRANNTGSPTPSIADWAVDRSRKAREVRSAIPISMTVPGFTQLYFRESVLHGDVQVLTDRGWDHVHLDSSAWESASDMHNSLAAAFGFPDYYGQNLDALVDCLRDVVTGDYGFERLAAGGVVSISGFDHFQRTAAESAHALIDILARSSLEGLLQGFPIVTLLQSDDAKLQVPPLSGQPVVWNPAERLDSTRV